VRREILLGVLYSDLLGFHTYDYARHFLSSCTRILSFPTMPNGVEFEGRLAHVGTFPIGIDPTSFTKACFFFLYSSLCKKLTLEICAPIEPGEGVRSETYHRS